MVNTKIVKELVIKAHGKMIHKMGMGLNSGLKVLNIKDFMRMKRNKGRENIFGQMDLYMKVCGTVIN